MPWAWAGAVLAIFAIQVLAPAASEVKQDLHAVPLQEHSAAQMFQAELERDDDLWRVVDQMGSDDWIHVFLVDVEWFYAIWPFSERAELVHGTYTDRSDPAPWWAERIERDAHATVLRKWDRPMNHAIRDVYSDCVVADEGNYVLIRGRECAGRAEALAASLERHTLR